MYRYLLAVAARDPGDDVFTFLNTTDGVLPACQPTSVAMEKRNMHQILHFILMAFITDCFAMIQSKSLLA